MELSAPLDEFYSNKYPETPNRNQNSEVIVLKKNRGLNSMGLSAHLADSKATIFLKHQTVTKTFILLQ